jgi:hypothetical protein
MMAGARRPAGESGMKYHVRNEYGELVVSSLRELQKLYGCQFIGDDDEIRREGTERWIRAAEMPTLKVVKPQPWLRGHEFAWLAVAICAGTLILALLMG